MGYCLVNKKRLVIANQQTIPIPMSHIIETKAEALQWMTQRGMQAECEIMSESLFRALNGWLPEVKNDNSTGL